MTIDHIQGVWQNATCLYAANQVEAAIDAMAQEISSQLGASNPVILCVMTGAVVVTGKLLTRLTFPLELDYLHLSRYGNNTTGGELDWKVRPSLELAGRTVLVVDDILDEGKTLEAITGYCLEQGAAGVMSAVLVDKQHTRKSGTIRADFVALKTGDHYLFGYGMDYKGYLRNAPGIYAVNGTVG